MASVNGYSAYSQTQSVWNQNAKSSKVDTKSSTSKAADDSKKEVDNIKTSEWKPIDTKSALIPTKREDIGMAIGDVQLSDKAKDYYKSLKAKFGNMEFIAVSKDMMSQVKANAAAYGNANKTVVLIDEEKLERMATDESFRKKYEGIIAMAQTQMAAAKNSLASSGANIKNFGMQVNEDGSTSFFATLEKSSEAQAKRIEKKQAEKKAAKAAEKKAHDKKVKEDRLEKRQAEKKAEKTDGEDKEYFKLEADSIEDLINKVSKVAYDNAANNVMADAEKGLGQNIDFEG
ncbi:MAG: DUF6033 family protein [Lachnospiraceae bacterium]|nr:DUF6033 family protein [Lachnospiraceae bacterium]